MNPDEKPLVFNTDIALIDTCIASTKNRIITKDYDHIMIELYGLENCIEGDLSLLVRLGAQRERSLRKPEST